MVWTSFTDMSTSGFRKARYRIYFIEADETSAIRMFREITGRDPQFSSCPCCGEDYSIIEWESLGEATGMERNLRLAWDPDGGMRYLEPDESVPAGWSADDGDTGVALEDYIARNTEAIYSASRIADLFPGDPPGQDLPGTLPGTSPVALPVALPSQLPVGRPVGPAPRLDILF